MQYDTNVDSAVISELSVNESVSFLELKKRLEGSLNRTLSFQTYNDHLKKMIGDNILSKKDSYVRGKPVFYSLTENADKQRQLNLLGVTPQQILYKRIYERIFFYEVYHSPLNIIQSEDELNALLSDIQMTTADLEEESSHTIGLRRALESERKLLVTTDTVYQVKNYDIRITKTEYWEASKYIQTKYAKEYSFTLPGVSMREFLNNSALGKLGSADVEKAFSLLIRNGLIKPCIIIHGEMRYTIANKDLHFLIKDLRHISWIEGRWLKCRWYHAEGPTREEQERANWLLGQKEAARIFREAEMSRFRYKKTIKKMASDIHIIDYKKYIEKTLKETKTELDNAVKEVKETQSKTIKQYEFLHDVLRTTCPMVLK